MDSKRQTESSLNKKNKITMTEIRLRKKELKGDLDLLEGTFESRITNLRKKVTGFFQPADYIKKNPIRSVGSAVVLGIVLGLSGKKKSNRDEEGTSYSNRLVFSSLLMDELKRIAARRAASYVSEMINQKINSKKEDS
jgi:ElaB/YqjD/DUF883 family membrane-anchored ribosome-binding protein